MTATVLVIVHGLVAVVLLGAITHQTFATWASAGAKPGRSSADFAPCLPSLSPTRSSFFISSSPC